MTSMRHETEHLLGCVERYTADTGHARQVCRLSLQLFDELQSLHGMGDMERRWLGDAALLHDIGWVLGARGHHKRALDLILADETLPFDPKTRRIVGSIARYHRKALPKKRHPQFVALDAGDQETIRACAALLRIADGLDVSHSSVVRDLVCRRVDDAVVVTCSAPYPALFEEAAALKKSDLFREFFGLDVVIEWQTEQQRA
jgi:exopolyphosphatase/pppGpp-phosphohydrolase